MAVEYSDISFEFFKIKMQDDSDFRYRCAVKYMALTEIYDRCISDVRSRYDPTEAFLSTRTQRVDSSLYAESVLKSMNIRYIDIRPIVNSYCGYPAQWWIDEYRRIFGEVDSIITKGVIEYVAESEDNV